MQYIIEPLTTGEKMERIARALAALDQQTGDLRAQVAALDAAGTCTGYVRWRKEKGRTPKPYVHHRAGDACPVHGPPPANNYLRVYVGIDPDRQAEANGAIERHRVKTEKEQQIERAEIQTDKIERIISNAYYAASNLQRRET